MRASSPCAKSQKNLPYCPRDLRMGKNERTLQENGTRSIKGCKREELPDGASTLSPTPRSGVRDTENSPGKGVCTPAQESACIIVNCKELPLLGENTSPANIVIA